MTKFIFHGGGVDQTTGNNELFYRELVKDIPNGGTLLLCYFASREDDYSQNAKKITNLCKQLFSNKDLNVELATRDIFFKQIAKADAIYFRGGSTEKLLSSLKEYDGLKEALAGKVIGGSSAGAYALSTYFSSHYEDIAQEGLGIAPVRVVTHYGSDTMPPRVNAVEVLKRTAEDLELIILKEGEWRVVKQ